MSCAATLGAMIYSARACVRLMHCRMLRRPPKLHSVATMEEARLARAMGIGLDHVERSQPIRFMYDTPISRPVHDFREQATHTINLEAEADTILVFGMVEVKPVVNAARLVIDPQSPGLTDLKDHIEWSAEKLAIVGNHREILGLAGSSAGSVGEAVEQVRRKYSAEIVVAKCGPRGGCSCR